MIRDINVTMPLDEFEVIQSKANMVDEYIKSGEAFYIYIAKGSFYIAFSKDPQEVIRCMNSEILRLRSDLYNIEEHVRKMNKRSFWKRLFNKQP